MTSMSTKTLYAVGLVKKEVQTSIGLTLDLSMGKGGCGVLPVFESEKAAREYIGVREATVIPIEVACRKGDSHV